MTNPSSKPLDRVQKRVSVRTAHCPVTPVRYDYHEAPMWGNSLEVSLSSVKGKSQTPERFDSAILKVLASMDERLVSKVDAITV